MKKDLCFVSLNLADDLDNARSYTFLSKNYILPDGQSINVNTPRFYASEALFNPSLIKHSDETPGMHQMCHKSAQECDVDLRRDLYSNIILSGGNTLYQGLPDRLEKELDALCP